MSILPRPDDGICPICKTNKMFLTKWCWKQHCNTKTHILNLSPSIDLNQTNLLIENERLKMEQLSLKKQIYSLQKKILKQRKAATSILNS
jgi:hypothetical protein